MATQGLGNRDVGAPRWPARCICTATPATPIVAQVTSPRQGVMPNWHAPGSGNDQSVTLYVHSLGGGE